ncbi:TIGR02270 family protein [Myxococcus eversor]|uniref:TIGR02270 family protein n=1 Tax=Myxococcus eversor TaxID=2709661 RepID=UPI0013D62024|nr:TIGR02270 family protein [Myxococcus eversor]
MTTSMSSGGLEVPRPIAHILEQHVGEVAFLWEQRRDILTAPHYRLKDLLNFDERLQANLEGLCLAGDDGWALCEEALSEAEDAGVVFAATVTALVHRHTERLGALFARVDQTPAISCAVTSALAWVPSSVARGPALELLSAVEPSLRRIGIAAAARHRLECGRLLEALLDDEALLVRARALRAVVELKRRELLPTIAQHLRASDDACRFWAATSAVLLGERSTALECVEAFAAIPGNYQQLALRVSLRATGLARAREQVRKLRENSAPRRTVVEAVGSAGDIAELPWLLSLAEDPKWCRPAAEAVSLVTGVNLEREGLSAQPARGARDDEPVDDEGEDETKHPDAHLPVPDPAKLSQWYRTNESRFAKHTKYFMGRLLSSEGCLEVIRLGTQRQRIAASIQACLLDSRAGLLDWRAPAWRQT